MHDALRMPAAAPVRVRDVAIALGISGFVACVLLAMGRPPICPCGYVELWHGNANDSGTSQHIADWYSLSHMIHGFIFYGLGALVFGWRGRAVEPAKLLFLSIAVEGFWELIENSPLIIERYRAGTVSDTYSGDSVLNSMADIGFMVLGFVVARRLPPLVILAAAVAMELLALYVIRDNLTLNVLMIVWPLDGIKNWQAAR